MNLSLQHHTSAADAGAGLRSGQGISATSSRFARSAFGDCQGFSLVEIIITVSLLTVIVLGLMAMFNQTQRAFRLGTTQTDVLETGRAVMDLIKRDLEQATASQLPHTTNFYAELNPPLRFGFAPNPLPQSLPGTTVWRTNLLQNFFFVTRANQQWTGIGYWVSNSPVTGIGTFKLYRFESAPNAPLYRLSGDFDRAPRFGRSPNVNPVADGVVHLRLRAFDTRGEWINPWTNAVRRIANAVVDWEYPATPGGEVKCYFLSNALPAYVEVELGILESPTLERMKAFSDGAVRRQFLERQAARVHLFRERVQIQNVDPQAYP